MIIIALTLIIIIMMIRSQVPDSVDRAIAITSVIGQPSMSLGKNHHHDQYYNGDYNHHHDLHHIKLL